MRLSPQARQQLKRFRSLKRGYGSFLALVLLSLLALLAELFVSNRALLVRYGGHLFVPIYGSIHPGTDFGQDSTPTRRTTGR